MKDFLFFTYTDNHTTTNPFWYYFREKGHSVDFVTQKNIHSFKPTEQYKNVIVYMNMNPDIGGHEISCRPVINNLLENHFKDSFLIHHNDTDHEDVQMWTARTPDLVMQREYTNDTKNPYHQNMPIHGFHFAMDSIEEPMEKDIDISFIGNMTNPRRKPFLDEVIRLSRGTLSHLNWFIDFEGTPNFKEMSNRSKIGLHYFGNSYDTWRIWELASCKTALIMPKLRVKSCTDEGVGLFDSYLEIRDDFSVLEEKILYLLEGKRYEDLANRAYDSYNEKHCPKKVFEYYYKTVMNYAKR